MLDKWSEMSERFLALTLRERGYSTCGVFSLVFFSLAAICVFSI